MALSVLPGFVKRHSTTRVVLSQLWLLMALSVSDVTFGSRSYPKGTNDFACMHSTLLAIYICQRFLLSQTRSAEPSRLELHDLWNQHNTIPVDCTSDWPHQLAAGSCRHSMATFAQAIRACSLKTHNKGNTMRPLFIHTSKPSPAVSKANCTSTYPIFTKLWQVPVGASRVTPTSPLIPANIEA